jgi:hypothetical protein
MFEKKNIISNGVDGIIYKSSLNSQDIVIKQMDKNILLEYYENLTNGINDFINVNYLASDNNFGPTIYKITCDNNFIWIYMEQLHFTLTTFITNMKTNCKSWSYIQKFIIKNIRPIHLKMLELNITAGDTNTDNYMIKNGKFKKIDFTKSKKIPPNTLMSLNLKKQLNNLYVLNPYSLQMSCVKLNIL